MIAHARHGEPEHPRDLLVLHRGEVLEDLQFPQGESNGLRRRAADPAQYVEQLLGGRPNPRVGTIPEEALKQWDAG